MYVDRSRELSILAFMAVVALILLWFAPGFFTLGNFRSVLIYTAYIAIAAYGASLAILTGNPDISVGSILAVCAMVGGHLAKLDIPIPLVILAVCATGGALGMINGLLVTRLGVHAIIVTLGTLGVYRGAMLYFTEGSWVYDLPTDFRMIGLGTVMGIPNPIWVAALTLLVGAFILAYTSWGRALYAVGSNPEAARLCGLKVPRLVVSAMTANGALVGLASLVFVTRFSTIQSNVGTGFEFLVITAVVVGGVYIFGGKGTVAGVALGSLLVGTTGTVLVFLEISAYWERTLHGLFILLAIGIGVLREYGRPRAVRRAGAAP